MFLQPVIMCGGTGSRLWPLSRANMPKPFVQLAGKYTLFQQTAQRVSGKNMLAPLVICAESHRFFVLEQLAQIGITPAAVILEPTPRGTAAAITLAALWAEGQGAKKLKEQAPLVILPADHLMGTPAEFQKALHAAAAAAQKHIVLFGIKPTGPNTEYGYIESGKPVGKGAFTVARFVEKPNLAKAQTMLKQGGFTWNSGIFTATAAVLKSEFSHAKSIWQQVTKAWQTKAEEKLLGTTLIRPGKAFAQTPNEPFDIAVMEKTATAIVMPYAGAWSDIGSFPALADAQKSDREGNTLSGQTLVTQTKNSFIHATVPHKIVAVHGMEDAVVVDTPDALLITHKSHAADVKSIFSALQKSGAPQAVDHARVVRPWGWYQTIAQGPGFLVKRIGVNPGGRLSLQYHHHRAEHWVITRGTATVTNGKKSLTLKADQSTYIPLGAHHRLENKTKLPLELVEVQTGTKLIEEDIVRLDDVYNRADKPATKRKK